MISGGKATEAAERGSGYRYDLATKILVELRAVADYFDETTAFERRFRDWVAPHLRRPAFVERLRDNHFHLPDAR